MKFNEQAGEFRPAFHFVAAVRADQQQVGHVGMRCQVAKQVQRRGVQPLQIVQEQDQRMPGTGEYPDEAAEHAQEARARLGAGKLRDLRLRAEQMLQVGDQVDDQAAMAAQRRLQRRTPGLQLMLGLAEQLANQRLECLGHGCVRLGALVLVELADREGGGRRREGLAQCVDQRGLADTGIAGDQHHPALARIGDVGISGFELRQLGVAAIESFAEAESFGRFARPGGKRPNRPVGLPLRQATGKIGCQPARALVAVARALAEQFHHDVGELRRHRFTPVHGRSRLPGQMAMDPFRRARCGQGQRAREQFVKRDAQRVQVASLVDAPMDAAGLLRCHIGERAERWGFVSRILAGRHRDAEAGQAGGARRRIEHDVSRTDIPVKPSRLVHLRNGGGQRDRDGQESLDGQRRPGQPRRDVATRIVQQQCAALLDEGKRNDRPFAIEPLLQPVFVAQAGAIRLAAGAADRFDHQQRRCKGLRRGGVSAIDPAIGLVGQQFDVAAEPVASWARVMHRDDLRARPVSLVGLVRVVV
nr:hypothetical protein [Cupriavidus gilardii]